MGLFGKKTEPKEAVEKQDTPVAVSQKKQKVEPRGVEVPRDLSSVLVRLRVTEKAVVGMERNVYVFEVRKDATKFAVRDAIKELFKVTPVRVNIVNKQPRQYVSRMRGRTMMEHGLKKAYVYLKEGDRIDVV